jgi:hypothetical protein
MKIIETILSIAAMEIQRVYRGYKYGRCVRNQLLLQKRQREQDLFFDYCATQIQKMYIEHCFSVTVTLTKYYFNHTDTEDIGVGNMLTILF